MAQGTITGRHGVAILVGGGMGRYEDALGETYTSERVHGQWTVTRAVWDEETQDWRGEPVDISWAALAQQHYITALCAGR